MRKRVALVGVAVLAAALVFWVRRPAAPPPSLLLVTIDTLRADHVGAYGSTAGLTPTLDRLAARGWRFENAVASVPLTLPSHATILSGLEPLRHGVRNNGTDVFPESRETLALHLRAQGYATAAFVAAVVLDHRFGLSRGFNLYDDRIVRVRGGRSVLESERSCDEVSARALDWIKGRTAPYFAWVHFYEPHAPYAPPADLAAAHPGDPYGAEIAAADRCLARLVSAAEESAPGGLVIAVLGDHGEGLGEHGEATHGLFVYQSTLAIPMVIAGPGVAAGKRTAGVSRTADLAPTLLGILKSPPLPGIDGRDLAAAAGSEAYAESEYGAAFGWAPLRSWRLGKLKLIDAPSVELYDLDDDPKEMRNLAPARAADVSRLQGVLRSAASAEVRGSAAARLDPASEERLRSLGYVAGGGADSGAGATARLDPKDALPLFQAFERAMAAEAAGDLKTSVEELTRLVAASPRNLRFRRSLASALGRAGQGREAVAVLRETLAMAPGDATTVHDLAMALSARGQIDEAVRLEEQAIAADPGFVDALDHLASLRAGRGEFEAARAAVVRSLALDDNNPRAWSNRGNLDRVEGRSADAQASYRRAVELDPSLADAWNGLGVLAVEQGRADEARGLFSRALEADPALAEARLNLAVAEAQTGRRGEAVRLAEIVFRETRDGELKAKAAAFLKELGAGPP